MKRIIFLIALLLVISSCGGRGIEDSSNVTGDSYGLEVQGHKIGEEYILPHIRPLELFKLNGNEFRISNHGHPLRKILRNPEREYLLKSSRECIKSSIGSIELMSLKGKERSDVFNMITESGEEFIDFEGGVGRININNAEIRFDLMSIRPDGRCKKMFKNISRITTDSGEKIRGKIKRSTLEEELLNGGDLVLIPEVIQYHGHDWVDEMDMIASKAEPSGAILLTSKGEFLTITDAEKVYYQSLGVEIGSARAPVYIEKEEVEKIDGLSFLKNIDLARDLLGSHKVSSKGVGQFKFAYIGDVYLLVHRMSGKLLIHVEVNHLNILVNDEGKKSEHDWDEVFSSSNKVNGGVLVAGDFNGSRAIYFTFKKPLANVQLIGSLKIYASEGWE